MLFSGAFQYLYLSKLKFSLNFICHQYSFCERPRVSKQFSPVFLAYFLYFWSLVSFKRFMICCPPCTELKLFLNISDYKTITQYFRLYIFLFHGGHKQIIDLLVSSFIISLGNSNWSNYKLEL